MKTISAILLLALAGPVHAAVSVLIVSGGYFPEANFYSLMVAPQREYQFRRNLGVPAERTAAVATEGPGNTYGPITNNASFEQVWDACLTSLEDRGLQVDRRDRRFGLIVSEPVVGKQFFEFWRNDTADSDELLNSSLHTIRRVVTIRIAKQGPMQFQVNVEAHAQRVSLPGDQLDNAAEAFELLGRQGVPTSPSRGDYIHPRAEPIWVEIGREDALEQALMRDIVRRLKS